MNLPNERVRGAFSDELNDKLPFITLQILTISQKGREVKFQNNEIEIITTTNEATLSLNAYGNNALAVVEKLKTLFYASFMLGKFKKCGLGLVSVSAVRDLTQNFGAGVEQRANIDLVCSYINRVEVPLNAVEIANFGIKVNR
ncbi:hypothetical protein U5B43_08790 [Campylobacter sp. 9BO]|uniref:phage neck terminator protein n=1 Tax=Campylobacter sp. 9BO TaxID=3424759 RepID=UPI003D3502ED